MLRFARPVVFAVALMPARAAPAADVGAQVWAQVRRAGRAHVVVALRTPSWAGGVQSTRGTRTARMAALRARVLRAAPPGAVTVTRPYATVAGFAAFVSAAGLAGLAEQPGVLRVDADLPVAAALATSVPQIGADRVHARSITGRGVVVAVFDTGVRTEHPDLAGARVEEECFCRPDCCPDGSSRQSGPGSARTESDHGVHVAGVIASRGNLAAVGTAPAVDLVAVRVLDDAGRGFLSDAIAGLDWLANFSLDPGDLRRLVRVVNMSLGTTKDQGGLYPGVCDDAGADNRLLARLIDLLYRRGVLVFAAAGNDGEPEAIASPACIRHAVAVGAVDSGDRVWPLGDSSPMLDLLAPGVQIVSDGIDGPLSLSGTSMATAHAAGLAALLVSAKPGAPAATVQEALRATGVAVTDARNGRSTPRVDGLPALNAVASQASLLFGGGNRGSDCLLTWDLALAGASREHPRAMASCRDNDFLCDADQADGQCTFLFSLCFNRSDPLLPRCAVDETLRSYTLRSPRPDAPEGTVERDNAQSILRSLPLFPLADSFVCGTTFPFVVPRPLPGVSGFAAVRMSVHTDTRRDADVLRLICEVPAQ